MKLRNLLIHTILYTAAYSGIFSDSAFAVTNVRIADTKNPNNPRIYPVTYKVDDQQKELTVSNSGTKPPTPMSDLEVFVNGTSVGFTGSNGKIIIKPTGIEEIVKGNEIPKQPYLNPNYPNPFNPETKIEYGLNKRDHVKLIIYNILGQEVVTLFDKEQLPGKYTVVWDGKDNNNRTLSSGVYFYRMLLENSGKVFTHKMTLQK